MYKIIVKNSLQNRKNQHLLANTIIKPQGFRAKGPKKMLCDYFS